jgi:cell division protein FtsL
MSVKLSVVGAPKKRKKKTTAKDKQLATDWEALLLRHGSLTKTARKPRAALSSKDLGMQNVQALHGDRFTHDIPSHAPTAQSVQTVSTTVRTEELSPEMQEREKAARKVRHVVAPVANKMGYQLITNPDDFRTMGRKT